MVLNPGNDRPVISPYIPVLGDGAQSTAEGSEDDGNLIL